MLEPRIVAISVSRFVAAVAPADTGEAEAAKSATLRPDSGREYKEFPGRSHFTVGQEGWEEVAHYALDWASENAQVQAPA